MPDRGESGAPAGSNRHNPTMAETLDQSTLDNGIRIVSRHRPGDRFAMGLWLHHGSRHETPDRAGCTHLLEHLWFAGIDARAGAQVAATAGEVNARTGRELSALYGSVPARRWRELATLLCTMLVTPRFTDDDLVRERRAIADERERHDAGRIEDLACAALWPGHPLALPVAGSPAVLAGVDSDRLLGYHREIVCGARLRVIAVGPVPHRDLADACGVLADLEPGTPALTQPPETRWENPLWALPTPGWPDPARYALLLADQLLGMRFRGSGDCALGSRLTLFSDAGLLLVEAAAVPERRPACRQAVERALGTLAAGTVTRGDLQRAAAALHARLAADPGPLGQMHRLGRELWYLPRVPDLQEHRTALAAVTPADLERALAAAWQGHAAWP